MNSEVIERSKRLEECAQWHGKKGLLAELHGEKLTAEIHLKWAADIRAIIIPPPVEIEKQVQCKGCGRILKASSKVNFEIVKIDCVCGARTEND